MAEEWPSTSPSTSSGYAQAERNKTETETVRSERSRANGGVEERVLKATLLLRPDHPHFLSQQCNRVLAVNKVARVVELLDLQLWRCPRFLKLCQVRPVKLGHSVVGWRHV